MRDKYNTDMAALQARKRELPGKRASLEKLFAYLQSLPQEALAAQAMASGMSDPLTYDMWGRYLADKAALEEEERSCSVDEESLHKLARDLGIRG